MKRVTLIFLICALSWTVNSCQAPTTTAPAPKAPKNVILLIADGTGLSQISSAFYFGKGKPNYGRFPVVGLIQTSSTSHKITDSAAGATAFSTGVKSYNGAIGVDADTVAHKTLVELAADRKLKTGLIATSSITHATPASFFAHVPSRNMADEIARELSISCVDFFAGGGLDYFANREDGLNLLDSMAGRGYEIDTTALAPKTLDIKQKYGWLLSPDGMPKISEGRGEFLTESTNMAIDYLDQSDKGFFLMVEGSQVDWGGHANDADYLVDELLDFDHALGAALDFAEKDGNTLIVVTADHETGGFALSSTPKGDSPDKMVSDYDELTGTFSTGGHTATLIPVFAYGPGAEAFTGVYENNEIFHKIVDAWQWKIKTAENHASN